MGTLNTRIPQLRRLILEKTSYDTTSEIDETLELEVQRCLDSIRYIAKYKGHKMAGEMISHLTTKIQQLGITYSHPIVTPYINTIPESEDAEYLGNREVEQELESIIRWNAMAMVINANRAGSNLGGHISTFASSAVLLEVGFNHFFHGNGEGYEGDHIFFQGHASPGAYSRAFLEGRLSESNLYNFRKELATEGGLSSYPHPYLMPKFWQFPTVSMGLGPILSIYQARFNRYLKNRNLLPDSRREPKVWCFIGDGESDEPESLGALTLAGREQLDNLIFVVNCNLQRLDGPVRGNGKIIQELEGVFRGAGWNVIKVVWGSEWDELLRSEHRDLLIKRMNEVVDGEYQKYSVMTGAQVRKAFFGKYPELLEIVNHFSDDKIKNILRGGLDPQKVYSAYKSATEHKGSPTVILAKTIKGYGLGESGEGKNISHQQKKLNEKELREFKERWQIPIDDDEVVETPFYKPAETTKVMKYLHKQRKALGGYIPERNPVTPTLDTPDLDYFKEFFESSGDNALSTTMSFVRILMRLLRHEKIGKHIVPIIPDEGRTFGMEALFRQIGIYASKGQLYEPADSESLLYYREAKDGQMLEEGINEAGAMSSFISAGTSYSTHGVSMIPFYIYYSMFGFQRIGDLMWLAGDIRCKGFLLGGTSGRTTLNGEGLQHQDGHSLLLMSVVPSCIAYEPAFRFELAVIIQDGLRRMYGKGEDLYYYLAVHNENYTMPEMPKGAEEGIIKGIYKFKKGSSKHKVKAHIFGSGSIMLSALKAQEILEEKYGVSADVWSVTSYQQLRRDALDAERYNLLNPDKKQRVPYITDALKGEEGPFISVSDNMKVVADQIDKWVPGGLMTLGTDGFGRSDMRENLRRYFEVDAEFTVLAVLTQLAKQGKIGKDIPKKAIKQLGIDPNKVYPISTY